MSNINLALKTEPNPKLINLAGVSVNDKSQVNNTCKHECHPVRKH